MKRIFWYAACALTIPALMLGVIAGLIGIRLWHGWRVAEALLGRIDDEMMADMKRRKEAKEVKP